MVEQALLVTLKLSSTINKNCLGGGIMKNIFLLILVIFSSLVVADTPPPNTVKAKVWSGDGNTQINANGNSLDTYLTNSSVAVTGTFWQSLQPISGTVTCNAGTGTLQVSLASLPSLAAGSNTIGNVNINGTVPISGTITATNSANGNTGSAVPVQATQMAGSNGGNLVAIKVSGTGVQSVDASGTTVPVSAAALPLPSGAATAAKQPALGTAGTPSADVITVQGAASMTPIKIDGSAVTQGVNQIGRIPANAPIRNSYVSTTVTTSAYVQMVASTSNETSMVCIFDSSGQDLVLATGASGFEIVQMEIIPGGNGCEPLSIPAGSRIAVEAKSANAATGYLLVNLYQ